MAENDESGNDPQSIAVADPQGTGEPGGDSDALKAQLAEMETERDKVAANNATLLAEKRNAEKESKKAAKELAEYREIKAKQERKALEGKGDYEKIIKKQGEEKDAIIESLKSRYHKETVDNRLHGDMAAAGFLPEAVPDAVRLLSSCFSVNDDDVPIPNEDAIRQLIPGWQPITATEGRTKTMKDILLDFGLARPHFMVSSMTTGAGPSSQSGKTGMTLQAYMGMSQVDQEKWGADNPDASRRLMSEALKDGFA